MSLLKREVGDGRNQRGIKEENRMFFMLGEETIDLIGDFKVEKVVGFTVVGG